MNIGPVQIGFGHPVCVIAEIGPNHNGSLELAKRLIDAAKESGADVVKLQMYEPRELTVDSQHPAYQLTDGPWKGKTLWQLYSQAQTPWSWMPELIAHAEAIGIPWFASVFSVEGVAYLESLGCPAYKIASAEVTHLELVRAVAKTGKPIILSDGMASDHGVNMALRTIAEAQGRTYGERADALVLRCVSEYPADPASYGLGYYTGVRGTIGPWGISDHTLTNEAAITAVALGARVVEKHLMLEEGAYWTSGNSSATHVSLGHYSPPLDAGHSLTPRQFKNFVQSIRRTEAMLSSSERKISGSQWRRRLVFARDLPAGHVIMADDLTAMRCGQGVEPKWASDLCGHDLAYSAMAGDPVMSDVVSKLI